MVERVTAIECRAGYFRLHEIGSRLTVRGDGRHLVALVEELEGLGLPAGKLRWDLTGPSLRVDRRSILAWLAGKPVSGP